jgi:hypothetical protein
MKFAVDSVLNTVSVAGDVVTLGGGSALTASLRANGGAEKIFSFFTASADLAKRLPGRPTALNNVLHVGNNGYTEIVGALSSDAGKLLLSLAKDGYGAISNQQINQLKANESLWGALKDFGVLEADLRTSVGKTVLTNFAAKAVLQTTILIAAAAFDSDDNSLKDTAKDVLRYGGERLPVAGGVIAQINSYYDNKKALNERDQATFDAFEAAISQKKAEEAAVFRRADIEKLNALFDQARGGSNS